MSRRIAAGVDSPARLVLLTIDAGRVAVTVPVTAPVTAVVATPEGGFRAVAGATLVAVPPSGQPSVTTLPAAATAIAHSPAVPSPSRWPAGVRSSSLTAAPFNAPSPCGSDGAVAVVTDRQGRFVVADTRDGELIVFSTGPLYLRQRAPVAGAPYGAAYDPRRNLLWLT